MAREASQHVKTDGPYAFFVLTLCILLRLFVVGHTFTFGLYVNTWIDAMEASNRQVVMILSVSLISVGIGALAAALCVHHFGFTATALLGAALSSTGFLFASLIASSTWHLAVLLGGCTAFGSALIDVVTFAVSGRLFVKRRQLWSVLFSMSRPLGIAIRAPLTRWLLVTLGWRHSLLFYAATTMLVAPALLFMRRSPTPQPVAGKLLL